MDEVVFSTVDGGSAEAQWAMGRYFDELDHRFPGGFDPGDALATAANRYRPPAGLFVVGHLGDDVVACVALEHLDAATAEIKRMWVDEACRGQGLARRLLAHIEAEARAAGARVILLDTNGTLLSAIVLYRSSGYAETAPYNDNPYAELWFRKELAP